MYILYYISVFDTRGKCMHGCIARLFSHNTIAIILIKILMTVNVWLVNVYHWHKKTLDITTNLIYFHISCREDKTFLNSTLRVGSNKKPFWIITHSRRVNFVFIIYFSHEGEFCMLLITTTTSVENSTS